MRRLLFLVLLCAVGLAVVGYYRDWFRVSTGDKAGGTTDVGVTVDKDKIKADVRKAEDSAKDLGSKAKAKIDEARPRETSESGTAR